MDEVERLKAAIDGEDVEGVKALLTRVPALHGAAMGYGKNGPLTWVAECRGAASPPSAARLEMARWMIENGSDVHQGGDGPLMRAALNGKRVAMMEVLLAHGADVNAMWAGRYPIVFGPCECVDPVALEWLLAHGANPNCGGRACGTALDYLLGGYVRKEEFGACIELLLEAGGRTTVPAAVLALLRGRLEELGDMADADGGLLERRFEALTIGGTGGRRMTVKGGTLLHVAAEFGNVEATRLLLDRGADVNARATVDAAGVGGQTALFHAVTQFGDYGVEAARVLLERGADVAVRARVPGHYERPEEVVECTAGAYAELFPEGGEDGGRALMRSWGAR